MSADSRALGLRRLLIDYDSTLNPGQGNAPLTAERAALLSRFLTKWRDAGVELHVLTSSNPAKKTAALKDAGLFELFVDVLSSTEPKRYKCKGDYIAARVKQDGWLPLDQLLADDAIEAVQSVWQDAEGENRPGGAVAHTLRLPQHSKVGLTEADLEFLDARVCAPATATPQHAFAAEHAGQRFVDEADSAEKCMLDSLPAEARAEVLKGAPPDKQRDWLPGRPDYCAAAGVDPPAAAQAQPQPAEAPLPSASSSSEPVPSQPASEAPPQPQPQPAQPPTGAPAGKGKGKGPPGKAGSKGPPPPKPGGVAKPKAKVVVAAKTGGLSGMAELLNRVEAEGKRKDEQEATEIEQVDLSQIDESARRERVACPRCEKEVLKDELESHMSSHSSEILPWLFLGGNRNAENDKELTIRTGITHILNVALECNMWDDIQAKTEVYNKEQGLGFTYKKMPMVDLPNQDLLPQLDEAMDFMHDAHTSDSRHHVLVHCVQGISRSASVVVAYLIKYEGMSLREAHEHVLRCRPIAQPRQEFVDQLGRFECRLRGCSSPSLTGEEVFADKSLLNLDATPKVQEKGTGKGPGKAPPPKRALSGSEENLNGDQEKDAAQGKAAGKGKGPGKAPPPPKRTRTDSLPEGEDEPKGKAAGKGKGPGKAPPPPKRTCTGSLPQGEEEPKLPPVSTKAVGKPAPPPPKRHLTFSDDVDGDGGAVVSTSTGSSVARKKPPPPKRSATCGLLLEQGSPAEPQGKGSPPPGKVPPPTKRAATFMGTSLSKGEVPGPPPPAKGKGKGPPPPPHAKSAEDAPKGPEEAKGKGKGKGPPPPAPAKSAKPTAEGPQKAAPAPVQKPMAVRASVMKAVKAKAKAPTGRRIPLWEAWPVLGAQQQDGSFPAAKLADRLQELNTATGVALGDVDFLARLNECCGPEQSEAFSTVLAVELLRSVAKALIPDEFDRKERMESVWNTWGKMKNNPFGSEWERHAQDWLTSLQAETDFGCAPSKLIDEWFTTARPQRSKGKGLSEEDRLKRQELQRKKSAEAREKEAERAAHWRSLTAARVEDINWSEVRQTMWCAGGMGGAALVQLGDSEAVVLKPQGLSAVAENVAFEVAELIDVRVARLRTVSMLSDEYFSLVETVMNAPKMEGECHNGTDFICCQTREFIGVVEFVPGSILQGAPGQEALQSGGKELLDGLGELIAFDCLLNNVDRVPAIWSNDGNLSNVMVVAGTVIGIDQQVNPITDPVGRQKYLDTLASFCVDAFHTQTASKSVSRIRTALELNCGYQLSDEGASWVLAGAARCFRRIAERREQLLAALPSVDAKMTQMYGGACADVGMSRLDLLIAFLCDTISCIAKASAQGEGASAEEQLQQEEALQKQRQEDGLQKVQVQATEVKELCHQIKDMVGELKGCLHELVEVAAGAGDGGAAAGPALQQVIGAATGMANSAEAAVGRLSQS